ncbi:MAG: ABC transporter ATP-binding protein [Solirubrobacteraceae bacterium]
MTAASPFSGGRRLQHSLAHELEQAEEFERLNGPTPTPAEGDAAVEFRKVRTEVDGVPVLDQLSISIAAGKLTALVGSSGAGKGALIDQMLGGLEPVQGEVIVLGQSTRGISADEQRLTALRRRIGVVVRGRDAGLFSSWSIYDNVALLLRNELGLGEDQIAQRAHEVLDQVGLTDVADRLPESIGFGQRKRGGLARALVGDPALVILDELESGVERPLGGMLAELVMHLHERRGGTFLSFTQDLEAARTTADEIILINRGRYVASGSPARLAASPNPHVRALVAADFAAAAAPE